MEAKQQYKVFIQGVGIKLVSACSRWHATEVAYTNYSHLENDMSKYTVMLKGLVLC